MERIDAVIFDLEGVIVNSESIWTEADLIFLKNHGVEMSSKEYGEELQHQLMGLVLQDGISLMKKHFGFSEEPITLVEERRAIVKSLFGEGIEFIPGFPEFHTGIRNTHRTAIATSLERNFLDPLDKRLRLSTRFSGNLYSVEDVGSISKPDPTIFLHAARQLQVNPKNCLVIEDAPNGLEAARRAGMRCVALTTSSPREMLSGATLVVDTYREIDLSRL